MIQHLIFVSISSSGYREIDDDKLESLAVVSKILFI
jgi:hypothetical protein